jgi:hypothetical protein
MRATGNRIAVDPVQRIDLPMDRMRWSVLVSAAVAACWILWRAAASGVPVHAANAVVVHDIRVVLAASDLDRLRANPRTDVDAVVTVDGHSLTGVTVHVKGSTGSFRPVEDRPGLTLRFDRSDSDQRGLGHRTLHLNNSVEDASLLQEQLGAALFRIAGVPAPEVGHARVTLNGKSRGLYVWVAGLDPEFLKDGFGATTARSLGEDDRLPRLQELLTDADLNRRWLRLQDILDIDRCVSFLAMEVILGHRDGYYLARNNFRLIEESTGGRLAFLPHGMDQLFGPADLLWMPVAGGPVARALLETPEGRQLYERRVWRLFQESGDEAAWIHRLDVAGDRLIAGLNRGERKVVVPAIEEVRERMRRRYRNLAQQLAGAKVGSVQGTHSNIPPNLSESK